MVNAGLPVAMNDSSEVAGYSALHFSMIPSHLVDKVSRNHAMRSFPSSTLFPVRQCLTPVIKNFSYSSRGASAANSAGRMYAGSSHHGKNMGRNSFSLATAASQY